MYYFMRDVLWMEVHYQRDTLESWTAQTRRAASGCSSVGSPVCLVVRDVCNVTHVQAQFVLFL